jgi:hypothetical protein
MRDSVVTTMGTPSPDALNAVADGIHELSTPPVDCLPFSWETPWCSFPWC